jgi:hypothetical protein
LTNPEICSETLWPLAPGLPHDALTGPDPPVAVYLTSAMVVAWDAGTVKVTSITVLPGDALRSVIWLGAPTAGTGGEDSGPAEEVCPSRFTASKV